MIPLASIRALAVVSGLGLCFASAPAKAEEVFWTKRALLSDFFRTSERVSYVKVEKDGANAALVELLGHAPKKDYVVFVAKTKGKVDGYAVIDDEQGQHEPITFGVKLDENGVVQRLEILVYREGYGSEIREARFRDQFKGVDDQSKLRFGSKVSAISGATISSKAMTVGVQRAIALVKMVIATSGETKMASNNTP